MIDAKALLADLKKLVTRLEDDLRERVSEHSEIDEHLRNEFRSAKEAGRTGQGYEAWRDEFLTQCAVAWILGTVFVRFLEDNELIETPRLSGPGERRQDALDQHTLFFQKHPTETDREYLLDVFGEIKKLPAAESLFDEKHNPLWTVGLSGDGATELLQFWQRVNPDTGTLDHDFTDPEWSTRFLGDLYQDLSESARKKYALLQTPEFVEEFILDRTLESAIEEFGFQEVRLIDPACGSGHFLLSAFHRLYERWAKTEPGTNPTELAQRALNQVYGIDINPYAIAIARFRLLLATLKVCEVMRLADAPGFKLNLGIGDSLLHGPRPGTQGARQQYLLDDDPLKHVYETEDAEELKRILGQRYHAVVGNPPYITVKDKALNAAYRERFASCYRVYSLAVPFIERFLDLARYPELGDRDVAGFIGIITSNSFMKREFGRRLVEQLIPKWDLTHVVDTSGAYIPGHGTPTVILFARSRQPRADTVRAVMGIRGEPRTPEDPAEGLVWCSIVNQMDEPGSESDFITVADTERVTFHAHPWTLSGGGTAELKVYLDAQATQAKLTLANLISPPIGRGARIAEEDAFIRTTSAKRRSSVAAEWFRGFLIGENIRDWSAADDAWVVYPYMGGDPPQSMLEKLWPWRTTLANRSTFQGKMADAGLKWYEYMQFTASAYETKLSIAFAFVATHNHFVLDRGGKVFNRSAPVIKLPPDATEDDHLALLGLLNSSTACFWMQQVFHNKGGPGGASSKDEKWHDFYEHDGTKLKKLPVPREFCVDVARSIDERGLLLGACSASALLENNVFSEDKFSEAEKQTMELLGQMISLQEELDWRVYTHFGLCDGSLVHRDDDTPPLRPGHRAFEIIAARRLSAGELNTRWFERTGAEPTTELPTDWPDAYRTLVERRIEAILGNQELALVEQPSFKRRWERASWQSQRDEALQKCLLDRLEMARYWKEPRLISCSQLGEQMRRDGAFVKAAELYRNTKDLDIASLIVQLVDDESVPFVSRLRYTASGIRKRDLWETAWGLQRLEDAIDSRTTLPGGHSERLAEHEARQKAKELGEIAVPPKYKSSDFGQIAFWRLRGKLDVPKERFISFPYCERAADPSPVLLWAGFNHLQQAQAIASYYLEMKEQEGWSADRLLPLLAGLMELLPWVKQWHNEPHPEHGERMGDYFEAFVQDEAQALDVTLEDIRTWEPPKKVGRGKRRKTRSA